MDHYLRFILLLLALICFVLSSIGVTGRVNLQSLGLVFLTAAFLIV
jgi:hypothetical protein